MSDLKNLKNKVLFYTDVDEQILRRELAKYERIALGKSDFLVRSGQIVDRFYYLEKGCICYYKEEEGEIKVLEFYTEDVFFTDLPSYVNQQPSNCYLKAIESSMVFAVKKEVVEESFNNSHQLERFGRLSMQEAFMKLFSRVERMSIRSNEERYLRLLEKRPDLFRRVPNYLIASYLGMTPVGLSKLRKRLSKA
ncbi:Crp/Fnr family transcriptional regulator [Muricauda sp. SCSIO 64092]|uniref:Crp/Fnr family transcriptional regulator n=1 Tax=Allomuricauda sp. SCSIO 64092 TaxID=2908842 RepID=UPI001FF124D2|nr:Crp/Fnr family transcriptional regulator [Muricauda sp. SCSIO 64092]UOY07156.1 Crp/Fnr family transcriptional regulator [Muricauda sp. SCSIO 64092]